ncbi:MAG: SGNH/GDSL hydrolase family protein [Candidatus Brocadiia bacterium]
MKKFTCLLALLIIGGEGLLFGGTAADEKITMAFESNPLEAGWIGVRKHYRPFDGEVVQDLQNHKNHFLAIRRGSLESPVLRCAEGQIYKLTCRTQTRNPGFWRVFFYKKTGEEIQADNYSRLYAHKKQWQKQTFFFEGRHAADFMKLGFDKLGGRQLNLDDIVLRPATNAEALKWMDSLSAGLPPVQYEPSPDRWKYLGHTVRKLVGHQKMRIVILGDSIANDTANSLFHLEVERLYPGCDITLVRSVRSGTGCRYYRRNNHVEEYVLRYRPDLLMIAGISNGNDPRAVRDVIRKTRKQQTPDILVLSGAVTPFAPREYYENGERIFISAKERKRQNEKFREELREMCAKEKVAFLDMRAIWEDYLASSPKPRGWYQRDPVHSNSRGKRVLGEILVRYFSNAELPQAP